MKELSEEQLAREMEVALPPHSPEFELCVLSCALNEPLSVMPECVARFKCGSDTFYELRHKEIYNALLQMYNAGTPIDSVTFYQHIKSTCGLEKCGGLEYLMALPDKSFGSSNFKHYSDCIADLYVKRQLLASCVQTTSHVYNNQQDAEQVIAQIETSLATIKEIRSNDKILNGTQAANLLSRYLEHRHALEGRRSGIVTGLNGFDRLTDGLQFGEQTIIGARPSQGKSSLLTTIVRKAALIDRIPTLVITLEMSVEALCKRMLSLHHQIPMNQLKSGPYSEADFKNFASFTVLINSSPIKFIDAISGKDIGEICSLIKQSVKNHGTKLVAIDYLQKIKPSVRHEKRTYEVAEVSGQLKAVAVQTGVAMLTLAQLNREPDQKTGRPPRLSDLADSGQIERDGDCIALLHRNNEEGKGHLAKLLIAKQRDGECGLIDLHFEGKYCEFRNPSFYETL